MRPTLGVLCTLSFLAAATAQPVLAQGLNADGLKRLPGVSAKETSPIRRLPKEHRAWIAQERAQRAAEPGDMLELAAEVEVEIGEGIMKVAERERIDTRDLVMAVMYDIMQGASDDLKAQIRPLETAKRKGALAADDEIRLTELSERKAMVDAKVAEVVKSQTVVSRSLVSN